MSTEEVKGSSIDSTTTNSSNNNNNKNEQYRVLQSLHMSGRARGVSVSSDSKFIATSSFVGDSSIIKCPGQHNNNNHNNSQEKEKYEVSEKSFHKAENSASWFDAPLFVSQSKQELLSATKHTLLVSSGKQNLHVCEIDASTGKHINDIRTLKQSLPSSPPQTLDLHPMFPEVQDLLISTDDGVTVIDFEKDEKKFDLETSSPRSAKYNSDGSKIAVVGAKDKGAAIFDASTGKKLYLIDLGTNSDTSYDCSFFHQHPNTLFALTNHGGCVVDIETKQILVKTQSQDSCFCCSVSYDDNLLAIGGGSGEVIIANAKDGLTLHKFEKAHDSWLRRCCFFPDNSRICSVGDDSRCVIMSVETPKWERRKFCFLLREMGRGNMGRSGFSIFNVMVRTALFL